MYLYTFVLLLVGITGLYSHLYLLQSSRQFSKQSSLGETMLLYHNASTGLARTNGAAISAMGTAFCFQTFGDVSSQACSWGTLTVGTSNDKLPAGYNTANFAFKSVVFGDGTHQYLLTYVAPPSAGNLNAPVTTPAIGYSVAHMMRQMLNTKVSSSICGEVKSNVFYTKAIIQRDSGAVDKLQYPVLSSIGLLDGTVGFLTPL